MVLLAVSPSPRARACKQECPPPPRVVQIAGLMISKERPASSSGFKTAVGEQVGAARRKISTSSIRHSPAPCSHDLQPVVWIAWGAEVDLPGDIRRCQAPFGFHRSRPNSPHGKVSARGSISSETRTAAIGQLRPTAAIAISNFTNGNIIVFVSAVHPVRGDQPCPA